MIRLYGTPQFFDQLPTRDKQLVVLGDAEHLIFQTPNVRAKVITLVKD